MPTCPSAERTDASSGTPPLAAAAPGVRLPTVGSKAPAVRRCTALACCSTAIISMGTGTA